MTRGGKDEDDDEVGDRRKPHVGRLFFTWWLPNGGGVHVAVSTQAIPGVLCPAGRIFVELQRTWLVRLRAWLGTERTCLRARAAAAGQCEQAGWRQRWRLSGLPSHAHVCVRAAPAQTHSCTRGCVGQVNDGLYRELVPLIDAVALSVEYMDTHLGKVRIGADNLKGSRAVRLLRGGNRCR